MELNQNIDLDTSRSLSEERRTKLKADQVRLLYAQSGIGSVGAVLGAVILGGALWNAFPHGRIVVWVSAYVVLFLCRFFLIHLFHRKERDDNDVIRWGTWHTVAVSAGALLWGVAVVFLFPQHSDLHKFLLAIFIAGIAAAGTVIYSPSTDYAANILLGLLPLSGRFIYEFDEFHVTIGSVILIFAGVLLLTGRRMHSIYADSLRLRYDKEELVDNLEHEIARRDVLEEELRKVRDDLEMRVEARTDELKIVNRTLGQEIIERKHFEEDLRKSEEKYRLLAENATDIVWTLDSKTMKFTYISPSLQKIRGYTSAELMELPLDKTMTPDSYARAVTVLGEELERDSEPGVQPDRIRLLEFRELCKDGSIIDTEARIKFLRDAHGVPTGLLGITRDITERKKAQKELHESREMLQIVLDTIPAGVFWKDRNSVYLGANRTWLGAAGLKSSHEVVGKTDYDLPWGEDEADFYREHDRRVMESGIPEHDVIETYTRTDGKLAWAKTNKVPLRDMEGAVVGILGTFEDITERKQAQEALRKSEEQYRAVFDNAGIGIDLLDRDGKIVKMNPALLHLLGYREEELSQRSFLEITHPDDREISNRNLEALVTGGTDSYRLEKRYLRKDGSIVWVDLWTSTVRGANGEHAGTVGVIQDITQRKRAEAALKESEEKFRNVVENMQDVFYRTDMQGTITMISPSGPGMIGYDSVDQIIGLNVGKDFYKNSDERDRLLGLLQEKGSVSDFEAELVRKDGNSIIVSTNSHVYYDKSGNPLGVEGVFNDITARKHAEQALRESEKKYRSLFEDSIDAIYMTTTDGTLFEANQAFMDLFGYRKEELIGQSILVIYSDPGDQKVFRQIIDEQGFVKDYSIRFLRKDGTEIDGVITFRVQLDREERIVGYRGIIRDQTEHNNLQKQLLEAQKMEAVGTLAGGIAHDFNNLLTVVMGFSELLLAEKDPKQPDYGDLQKISHAARSGAELVQRLLMFSRRSEPKLVLMNPNRQILQIEKLMRRTIPKMVEIKLELSADLPDINADVSQMEQVLINLAVNARDAMPDGGKLTMRTDVVKLDEEYCRAHIDAEPGDYVLLEVLDTGHGMEKETVEHIFEPFFTTKELGRGTGLGLAMVYGIVRQHNGHITVHSEIGKGTTFKVYLPAVPTEAEPDIEEGNIIPAFGTETVLLVDDEEFVRELGTRILIKYGYTVIQAVNGREALDLFKKNNLAYH